MLPKTNHYEKHSSDSTMLLRDWRLALRSPPTYRIGNRTFNLRFQIHFVWILSLFAMLVFLCYYLKIPYKSSYGSQSIWAAAPTLPLANFYNSVYPLTQPIVVNGLTKYRIGIIADLDTNSLCEKKVNTWRSYLKRGYLSYDPSKEQIHVIWDGQEPTELLSSFSLKGRGMELSELVVFNGKLLSFDDRTGFIYEIKDDKILPWIFLADGNGDTTKGFKSEWATIKGQQLYVGSMGKEWTTSDGEFESYDPMYVKVVNTMGEVHHLNWVNNYKALRQALSIEWPGYMIHESGVWSAIHNKWFFLPRRASKEKYNDTRDEHMGCNILLSTDDKFANVDVKEVGALIATHGFSSFKFLPGTNDQVIVALKTEELNGSTSTYIMAFTIAGKIVLAEEKIPTTLKYEGFEFI